MGKTFSYDVTGLSDYIDESIDLFNPKKKRKRPTYSYWVNGKKITKDL